MYKKVAIKVLSIGIPVILIAGFLKGANLYSKVYRPNIFVKGGKQIIFIPSDATIDTIYNILFKGDFVKNQSAFKWVVEKKNYQNKIKPGRYLLKDKMNNNELVNILRAGIQEPVKLSFNNIKTTDQFAERMASELEFSKEELLDYITNDSVLKQNNLNEEVLNCIFIPNTYHIYWDISPQEFFNRMLKEYNAFWNNTRLKKAEKIGLSKYEVATLASIVDAETNKIEEKPIIAGLYLNRMKKNIPLQADPTLKFALQDFTIRRLRYKHFKIESPYNTYKYTGLPPGPIALPTISGIDAVLNREKHDYLYFCAKEDFSGYHRFAKTLAEHNRNAKKYHKALNARKIY